MDRHKSFFDNWFDAYNAHDIDRLCALADPNVEIVPLQDVETVVPGATYHGHAGMRSLMLPGFERFPDLRIEPGDPIQAANHVIIPMTFVANGSAATTRFGVTVFTFAGERVARMQAFDSMAEARRSIGHATALTPREREIVKLLAEGLRAEDVAKRLVLSPYTVRTHIRNAKDKLGARTTAQAIAIAIRDRELQTVAP